MTIVLKVLFLTALILFIGQHFLKRPEKPAGPEPESSTEEIGTVTGGKWIQIASVWFYEKDGELVKRSVGGMEPEAFEEAVEEVLG